MSEAAGHTPPVRCFNPFQLMVVDATTGSVTPCCYWRHDPPCGNAHNSSLLNIWNGKNYRRVRAGMLSGDLAASCRECYALKQGAVLELNYDEAAEGEKSPYSEYAANLKRLKEDLAAGRTALRAKPLILSMTFTHKCNIRCRHCCQEATRDLPLSREGLYSETMDLAPFLSCLIIGGGEPFADPYWRRFFADWREELNPYLGLAASTNGTVITEDVLKQLSRFRQLTLNISFDGGTPEVYEKIRVGADFHKVTANVDKLADLARSKGRPSTCGMTMSVMKSNILDLPNFLKLCRRHRLPGGLSPVVDMPVHEALTMFNDARQETQGWRAMFDEVREMLTDDFLRPIYFGNEGRPEAQGLRDTYLPFFEAVRNSIPWPIIDSPAVSVRGRLPAPLIKMAAGLRKPKKNRPYRESPVLALFPKAEEYARCRYYADVDAEGKFFIAAPPGVYGLGLISSSTDWPVRNTPWCLAVREAGGGDGSIIFNRKIIIKGVMKIWAKYLLPEGWLKLYRRGRDFMKRRLKYD